MADTLRTTDAYREPYCHRLYPSLAAVAYFAAHKHLSGKRLFHQTFEAANVVLSMASKSVTTPIAMEVTQSLGGIPSLTAAVVVITGIIGALVGFKMLSYGHVNSPIAQGLSMGAASHAVGASTAMAYSSKYGAFASLGITLNGIFTALLTPTILRLMGII